MVSIRLHHAILFALACGEIHAQFINLPNTFTNVLNEAQNALSLFSLFNGNRDTNPIQNDPEASTVSSLFRALIVNSDGSVTIDTRACQTQAYVTLFDIHRPGGMIRPQVFTQADCLEECSNSRGCKSIDWDETFNGCFLHTAQTTLASMTGIPTGLIPDTCCQHSYLTCAEDNIGTGGGGGGGGTTNDTATVVPDNCRFITFFNTVRDVHSSPNYNLSSNTAVTLNACKELCRTTAGCVGLDWDAASGICIGFSSQSQSALLGHAGPENIINNTCCIHCFVVCPMQPPPTVATVRPVTAEVPLFQPGDQIPGESGVCPDAIGRHDNAAQSGGAPLSGTTTSQACKQSCLSDATCAAADFNKNTAMCFIHGSIVAADFSTDRPCCTHYRKTFCESSKCYSHATKSHDLLTGIADPYGEIRDRTMPELEEVDCANGDCFVTSSRTFVFDPTTGAPTALMQSTSRGCRSSSNIFGKTCTSSTTTDATDCSCSGTLCNAAGYEAIDGCLAYFPLDMDANDNSVFRRDGFSFNVGFGDLDARKGRSALFDGATSYIRLRDFNHYIFGNINDATGAIQPQFTAAMWIKRTAAVGDMVVFTNGFQDTASIELRSAPDTTNPLNHILTGSIRFGGTAYSVAGSAPMNTWQFIAFGTVAKQGGFSIQIFTSNNAIDSLTPTSENDGPGSTFNTSPIDIATDIVIGALPTSLSFDNTITGTNFFGGLIDEFYMFKSQISINSLQAIRESYDR